MTKSYSFTHIFLKKYIIDNMYNLICLPAYINYLHVC